VTSPLALIAAMHWGPAGCDAWPDPSLAELLWRVHEIDPSRAPKPASLVFTTCAARRSSARLAVGVVLVVAVEPHHQPGVAVRQLAQRLFGQVLRVLEFN
jgi:hypothetical protein